MACQQTEQTLSEWLSDHFEEIWSKTIKYLMHFTECSVQDAEECVAEVINRVLASSRYTGPLNLAFFYTSAYRARIDQVRKSRAFLPLGYLLPDSDELAEPGMPDIHLREVETVEQALQAFEVMTPAQRVVTILGYEGLSLKETADALGMSDKSVKALRYRARRAAWKVAGVHMPEDVRSHLSREE